MSLYSSKKNYSDRSFYRSFDQERSRSPLPFSHHLPRSPIRLSKPTGITVTSPKRPKVTVDSIDLVSDDDEDDKGVAEEKSEAKICSLTPFEVTDKSRRTLGPRRMLNDDIVHFYMKHVLAEAPSKKRDKFHVFNCFFYQKFKSIYMDLLKKKVTPESIEQEVRRWDKDVKIFDKEYLVIPVCEQLHWNLIVVAYPGLVQMGERHNEDKDNDKRPAVMIFDSLRLHYMTKFTGFIRNIFLRYRWKIERPNREPRLFESRDVLTEKYAIVPKQGNYYDCGIHMLHSFEMFLKYPRSVYKKVMNVESLSPKFAVDTTKMRERIQLLLPEVIEV